LGVLSTSPLLLACRPTVTEAAADMRFAWWKKAVERSLDLADLALD
jgi:hypothetical protein